MTRMQQEQMDAYRMGRQQMKTMGVSVMAGAGAGATGGLTNNGRSTNSVDVFRDVDEDMADLAD